SQTLPQPRLLPASPNADRSGYRHLHRCVPRRVTSSHLHTGETRFMSHSNLLAADDTLLMDLPTADPDGDLLADRRKTPRKTSEAAQSPLETYLREINETALLTAAEELELAAGVARGDVRARDRMVRANLRLVVNIARGYTGKGLGLQDLIEEGNLGLLRAVEGFDPTVGTRFSTYASYWIKQSIKRALINSSKTIRIPAYMVE